MGDAETGAGDAGGTGKIGWDAIVALARRRGCEFPEGMKPFGHGAQMRLTKNRWILGSYHDQSAEYVYRKADGGDV